MRIVMMLVEDVVDLVDNFISEICNKIKKIRYSEEERLDMWMNRVFSQNAHLKTSKEKDVFDFFDVLRIEERIAELSIVQRGVVLTWFGKEYNLNEFQRIGGVIPDAFHATLHPPALQALLMALERKKKLPSEILRKYQILIVCGDNLDGIVYIRERNLQQAAR